MKSILIVDDEQHIRDNLGYELAEEGNKVYKASSIGEAKKILSKEQIDYAVIDIKLDFTTGYGGIEVFKSAKKINPNIKCFILSAYSIEHLKEKIFLEDKMYSISENLFKEIESNYIYKSSEKSYIEAVFEKIGIEDTISSEYGISYAILIGIEDYDYFSQLRKPVSDCEDMREILVNLYGYSNENIIFLKNPLRKEIFNAFFIIKNKLSPKDSLLVFYAGHASWDNDIKQGYWLTKESDIMIDRNGYLIVMFVITSDY